MEENIRLNGFEVVDAETGYEVKSPNGIFYTLYEGFTVGTLKPYKGDNIFIMLDNDKYDEIFDSNNMERVYFVGFLYYCFDISISTYTRITEDGWDYIFESIYKWESKHSNIVNLLKGNPK